MLILKKASGVDIEICTGNTSVNSKFKVYGGFVELGLNTDSKELRKEVWRAVRRLTSIGLVSITEIDPKKTCIRDVAGILVYANNRACYCDGRTPAEEFYYSFTEKQMIYFIPFSEEAQPVTEIRFDDPLPELLGKNTTPTTSETPRVEIKRRRSTEALLPKMILRRAHKLNLDEMGRPRD